MSGPGHGAQAAVNKTVALIISVLAPLLAVAEILGQKAHDRDAGARGSDPATTRQDFRSRFQSAFGPSVSTN